MSEASRDPSGRPWSRREFLGALAAASAGLAASKALGGEPVNPRKPNVVFVFGDQWRAQATGYAGDPDVKTPHLDRLAAESVNFSRAVSGCPVCSPYRASLMTGQHPLRHGVFLNDAHLKNEAASIAEAFKAGGYETAYIGKWHLNGRGRRSFIPREDRQGFEYWKVLECTHDYNKSQYFADERERLVWDGYDAAAQTRDAAAYIRAHGKKKPFLLMLSWGPPHNPYETAPEEFRALYDPKKLALRPNVPKKAQRKARRDIAGYYAHCSALDACVGEIIKTLDETGLAEETIFVFTSDHGDMLYSQGQERKQRPWDESIRVPFLLRWPGGLGRKAREVRLPLNAPDLMPTLLGLAGLPVPKTVEGQDHSAIVRGEKAPPEDAAALLACYHPFGEWKRANGGREYRGVRTERYTYVRTLERPWLLYDNDADPHQMENRCGSPEHAALQARMEKLLARELARTGDDFRPSAAYLEKWNYKVDRTGTLPTRP